MSDCLSGGAGGANGGADSANVGDVERVSCSLLFEMLNGRNWRNNHNWNTAFPLDTWFGLQTNKSGNIVAINLRDNNLEGELKDEVMRKLAAFPSLQVINLSSNCIRGSLSSCLFKLSSLVTLDLAKNRISGPLLLTPDDEDDNKKVGGGGGGNSSNTNPTTPTLANTTTTTITYGATSLAEETSSGVTSSSGLTSSRIIAEEEVEDCGEKDISISVYTSPSRRREEQEEKEEYGGGGDNDNDVMNQSTCDIEMDSSASPVVARDEGSRQYHHSFSLPPHMSRNLKIRSSLREIHLEDNLLTGNLPESIGKFISLRLINLRNNKLSGVLPSAVCQLPDLEVLYLDDNNLIGSLPSSISNLRKLSILSLSSNGMGDCIPEQLCQLGSSLTYCDLSFNKFSKQIPRSIGNLKMLQLLALQGNNLSDAIPDSIGQLLELKQLYLHKNNLRGALPESIGEMRSLQKFYAYKNKLNGWLPDSFFNLKQLTQLYLHHNRFSNISQGRLSRFLFSIGCDFRSSDHIAICRKSNILESDDDDDNINSSLGVKDNKESSPSSSPSSLKLPAENSGSATLSFEASDLGQLNEFYKDAVDFTWNYTVPRANIMSPPQYPEMLASVGVPGIIVNVTESLFMCKSLVYSTDELKLFNHLHTQHAMFKANLNVTPTLKFSPEKPTTDNVTAAPPVPPPVTSTTENATIPTPTATPLATSTLSSSSADTAADTYTARKPDLASGTITSSSGSSSSSSSSSSNNDTTPAPLVENKSKNPASEIVSASSLTNSSLPSGLALKSPSTNPTSSSLTAFTAYSAAPGVEIPAKMIFSANKSGPLLPSPPLFQKAAASPAASSPSIPGLSASLFSKSISSTSPSKAGSSSAAALTSVVNPDLMTVKIQFPAFTSTGNAGIPSKSPLISSSAISSASASTLEPSSVLIPLTPPPLTEPVTLNPHSTNINLDAANKIPSDSSSGSGSESSGSSVASSNTGSGDSTPPLATSAKNNNVVSFKSMINAIKVSVGIDASKNVTELIQEVYDLDLLSADAKSKCVELALAAKHIPFIYRDLIDTGLITETIKELTVDRDSITAVLVQSSDPMVTATGTSSGKDTGSSGDGVVISNSNSDVAGKPAAVGSGGTGTLISAPTAAISDEPPKIVSTGTLASKSFPSFGAAQSSSTTTTAPAISPKSTATVPGASKGDIFAKTENKSVPPLTFASGLASATFDAPTQTTTFVIPSQWPEKPATTTKTFLSTAGLTIASEMKQPSPSATSTATSVVSSAVPSAAFPSPSPTIASLKVSPLNVFTAPSFGSVASTTPTFSSSPSLSDTNNAPIVSRKSFVGGRKGATIIAGARGFSAPLPSSSLNNSSSISFGSAALPNPFAKLSVVTNSASTTPLPNPFTTLNGGDSTISANPSAAALLASESKDTSSPTNSSTSAISTSSSSSSSSGVSVVTKTSSNSGSSTTASSPTNASEFPTVLTASTSEASSSSSIDLTLTPNLSPLTGPAKFEHPGSYFGCGGNPSGMARCNKAGSCSDDCRECGAGTHWSCCANSDRKSIFCSEVSLAAALANKKALETSSTKLTKVAEISGVYYFTTATNNEDFKAKLPPSRIDLKLAQSEGESSVGAIISSITFNNSLNKKKASITPISNRVVTLPNRIKFTSGVYKIGDRVKLKKKIISELAITLIGTSDVSLQGMWTVEDVQIISKDTTAAALKLKSQEEKLSSSGVKKDEVSLVIKQNNFSFSCGSNNVLHEFEKSQSLNRRPFKSGDKVKLSSTFNRNDSIHGGSNGCLGVISDRRVGIVNNVSISSTGFGGAVGGSVSVTYGHSSWSYKHSDLLHEHAGEDGEDDDGGIGEESIGDLDDFTVAPGETLTVNSVGDAVTLGTFDPDINISPAVTSGYGGGNGMSNGDCRSYPPTMIYYCGKTKFQCRCGTCSGGRCGPTKGCPCNDCSQLLALVYKVPKCRNSHALMLAYSTSSYACNEGGNCKTEGGPHFRFGETSTFGQPGRDIFPVEFQGRYRCSTCEYILCKPCYYSKLGGNHSGKWCRRSFAPTVATSTGGLTASFRHWPCCSSSTMSSICGGLVGTKQSSVSAAADSKQDDVVLKPGYDDANGCTQS